MNTANTEQVIIRKLGMQDYTTIWHAMQSFTEQRSDKTTDEFWLVEHPPVFTLGRNAKPEHVLQITDIPLINIDRGGQVTYHGPGQLLVYLLIDLKRRTLGVRQLVKMIEQSIIDLLTDYHLAGHTIKQAPGVYINNAKVAALGLRIKRACSFHGLSLNVAMDLAPFKQINPCGYEALEVVQLCDYIEGITIEQIQDKLSHHLAKHLAYRQLIQKEDFKEHNICPTISL